MSLIVKTPTKTISFDLLHFEPEHDVELAWLCEEAETACGPASGWETVMRGRRWSTLEEEERRVDAMRAASTIIGWLDALPRASRDVLVAAYRPPPRPFPAHYALKLGRLAGVAVMLESVQIGYQRAVAAGRTVARSPAEWLDEQLVRGDDERADAARREAFGVYARALAAYRAVRGNRPSLVPEES